MTIYENDQNNIVVDADFSVSAEALAVKSSEPDGEIEETKYAEKEAEEAAGIYTHVLRKPAAYENLIVAEIVFDWESLTGRDSLNIENEMQALGKMLVSPGFSGEYIVRMAARASNPKVGRDFFETLPLGEWHKIRAAGRSFLLKAE